MKLSERIRGYIYGKKRTSRISRSITDNWANEVAKLEAENEALMMAANSLLGLLDCLGSRMSLDDAGSDRKSLAELVDYPNYMNKKLALLQDSSDRPDEVDLLMMDEMDEISQDSDDG